MIIHVLDLDKTYYAVICEGTNRKKPSGSFGFLTLLNNAIVKARKDFPEFYMNDYTKSYKNVVSSTWDGVVVSKELHFYLFEKATDEIVGHVMGTDMADNAVLNQVEVSMKHRNKHVCSKHLVPLFVTYTGHHPTYSLVNTGGEHACKCYNAAFNKLEYEQSGKEKACPAYMVFQRKGLKS